MYIMTDCHFWVNSCLRTNVIWNQQHILSHAVANCKNDFGTGKRQTLTCTVTQRDWKVNTALGSLLKRQSLSKSALFLLWNRHRAKLSTTPVSQASRMSRNRTSLVFNGEVQLKAWQICSPHLPTLRNLSFQQDFINLISCHHKSLSKVWTLQCFQVMDLKQEYTRS